MNERVVPAADADALARETELRAEMHAQLIERAARVGGPLIMLGGLTLEEGYELPEDAGPMTEPPAPRPDRRAEMFQEAIAGTAQRIADLHGGTAAYIEDHMEALKWLKPGESFTEEELRMILEEAADLRLSHAMWEALTHGRLLISVQQGDVTYEAS